MTAGGDPIPRRTSSLTPRVSELAERVLDELAPLSRRVLFCEDEATVADFVTTLIRDEGLNVCIVHVTDGDEALERLHGECFDLMITDECHPGLRGGALCQASKSLHPSMPILMLTGCSAREMEQSYDWPPWNEFLSKRFGSEVFGRVIRSLLDPPDHGVVQTEHLTIDLGLVRE